MGRVMVDMVNSDVVVLTVEKKLLPNCGKMLRDAAWKRQELAV